MAPTRLPLFGILPAIGLALLLWIVRLIAVGRISDEYEFDLAGRRRWLFLSLMTLHLAVFGAIFWTALLLIGALVFDDPAIPLKAIISVALLFLFTTGLRNCLVELLIIRGARADEPSVSDI